MEEPRSGSPEIYASNPCRSLELDFKEKTTTDVPSKTLVMNYHPSAADNSPSTAKNAPPGLKEADRKSARSDTDREEAAQADSDAEEDAYKVEAVRKVRGFPPDREFYIKWDGYSESENTWEPEDNVLHLDVVTEYLEAQKARLKAIRLEESQREEKRKKEKEERRRKRQEEEDLRTLKEAEERRRARKERKEREAAAATAATAPEIPKQEAEVKQEQEPHLKVELVEKSEVNAKDLKSITKPQKESTPEEQAKIPPKAERKVEQSSSLFQSVIVKKEKRDSKELSEKDKIRAKREAEIAEVKRKHDEEKAARHAAAAREAKRLYEKQQAEKKAAKQREQEERERREEAAAAKKERLKKKKEALESSDDDEEEAKRIAKRRALKVERNELEEKRRKEKEERKGKEKEEARAKDRKAEQARKGDIDAIEAKGLPEREVSPEIYPPQIRLQLLRSGGKVYSEPNSLAKPADSPATVKAAKQPKQLVDFERLKSSSFSEVKVVEAVKKPVVFSSSESDDEDDVETGEAQYEIRNIIDLRLNKDDRTREYLVQWVGYDSDQDTWEPQENLQHLEIYKEFWERRKQAKDNLCAKKASKKKTTDSTSEDEGTRANDPFRHLKKMRSEVKKRRLEGTSKSKSSQKRTDLYGKVYQPEMFEPKNVGLGVKIPKFKFDATSNTFAEKALYPTKAAPLKSVNMAVRSQPEVPETPVVYVTEKDGIFNDFADQDFKLFKMLLNSKPPKKEPPAPLLPFETILPDTIPKPPAPKPDRFDGLVKRIEFLRMTGGIPITDPNITTPFSVPVPLATHPNSLIEEGTLKLYESGGFPRLERQQEVIGSLSEYFRSTLWRIQESRQRKDESYILHEAYLFLKFQFKNREIEDYLMDRDGVNRCHVKSRLDSKRAVKHVQRASRA